MRRITSRLLAAALLVAPLAARADIIIASGNNPQVDESILLNTGMTGNPIFGTSNLTGFLVRFSSNENITAPTGGQGRVEAADGTLTQLIIDVPGTTFTSLIWNLNAAAAGSTTFVVTENNGQQTVGTFALAASGTNFFTITAINGQRISSVALSTTVNMTTTNLASVSQIRVGGVPNTVVPEPGTVALLGTGLLGVVGIARRKRTTAA